MDFLQSLYQQYNDLSEQKRFIELNITKISELIRLNKGVIPDGTVSAILIPGIADIPLLPLSDFDLLGYNKSMSWEDKIFYILRTSKEPLTAGDIAKYIRKLEPETLKAVEKSITLTASLMGKDNKISVRKEGVRNYYSLKST